MSHLWQLKTTHGIKNISFAVKNLAKAMQLVKKSFDQKLSHLEKVSLGDVCQVTLFKTTIHVPFSKYFTEKPMTSLIKCDDVINRKL